MFKFRLAINVHKSLTPFIVCYLMHIYSNFTIGPILYLSLHGSYCVCWLMKEIIFPDKTFDRRVSLIEVILLVIALGVYWVTPFVFIRAGTIPRDATIVFAVLLFTVGMFFHFGADCQKNFILAIRRGELITDGFFATSRNPNYFGEAITYISWTLLAENVYLLFFLMGIFLVFMYPALRQKERSLSRHETFKEYKEKTPFCIPKLW